MGFGVSKCICTDVGGEKDSDGEPREKRSKFGFSPYKKHSSPAMSKVERALKAALLIQRWYRRYCARLEIRRRYTWTIFQTIEYAGEQDQMKLYNFFNALLTHMGTGSINEIMEALSPRASPTGDEQEADVSTKTLLEEAWLEEVPVESSYKGPRLSMPLTTDSIHEIIDAYKKKKPLHARYVYMILREGVRVLRQRTTITHATTAISGQITVVGDLHGKLDDLLTILYKNGLPSTDNPYVFNGDFVDRGRRSIEVMLLLLALVIVFPAEVYLNRGNHEDLVMNARYGFCKELSRKYKAPHGPRILRLLEEVYRWLPLATIIDNKVLVVHGGISLDTDLKWMATADRSKYRSVLRTPAARLEDGDEEGEDGVEGSAACKEVRLFTATYEWKQVLDLLWSDPQPHLGCRPNSFRGGGSYFGPDITRDLLMKNGLSLLIRSHECKPEGYEFTHNNTCLTIFSASNYYEAGSNRGAYVKLQGPRLEPHFVQYTADLKSRKLTIRERVGRMETSAFRELRCQINASKSRLLQAFQQKDKDNKGYITVNDWVEVMERESHLNLPWRVLREKLVTLHPITDMVDYRSTFSEESFKKNLAVKGGPTVVEALYRHKSSLETIFRLIDKDNSGYISMDEFSETCELLSRHIDVPIPKEDIADLARSIDINKDGYIDFNEFLECFRIVESGRLTIDEEDEEDERDENGPLIMDEKTVV
ncbi:serine/threonine-protein phosphatase with EF-hands 2-like isoform X2 [Penaeus japonicus]|uniref:serine/threonine-protein phosphatase with EF-hands 2-like isoform X2 n=1 Tax=Penaeus japonicus TaxID=27405 RepID=UPI001C70C03E|nr:serine/threonine-protein phosphatase with EF-hands 2-like isoform X2 [Penaeus japonicus]